MPRSRTVTMGKVTPQESYEAGIKKAIKLYSPHAVVDGQLVNAKSSCLLYVGRSRLQCSASLESVTVDSGGPSA